MKPIDIMSVAECLVALRDFNYSRHDIANRMNTLLYEQAQRHDARVDALENEINALRAKNRKPDSPTPSG